MRKAILVLTILISQIAYGQKKVIFPPPVFSFEVPEFMNLCDVPKHLNELVYTRLYYTGNGDYWSLHPLSKCNFVSAELYIPQSLTIQDEYLNLLKDFRTNFKNRCLIIDAIGVYQYAKRSKAGSLSHNKANFLVNHIVQIQEDKIPEKAKPSSH